MVRLKAIEFGAVKKVIRVMLCRLYLNKKKCLFWLTLAMGMNAI